jgi:hypothetical protein
VAVSPHTLAVLVVLAISSVLLMPVVLPRQENLPSADQSWVAADLPFLEINLMLSGDARDAEQRPVYPYSVIARGVASSAELKETLEKDPVVAAHYAGFDVGRARVVRAERTRAVYVSYRLGNRVFWTKNKMVVPHGEKLISDGTHLARTRCGNRISDTPMAPVSDAEPTANKFDEPSRPNVPKFPLEPMDVPELWASNETPASFPLSPGPGAPGGGIYLPPVPPTCCSGGGGPPVRVTPPPSIRTSEPGTLLLALIGLAIAALLRKR